MTCDEQAVMEKRVEIGQTFASKRRRRKSDSGRSGSWNVEP